MSRSMTNAAKHLHDSMRQTFKNERKRKRIEAVAPELLEALKQFMLAESMPCVTTIEALAYDEQFTKAMNMAREAIKRAES